MITVGTKVKLNRPVFGHHEAIVESVTPNGYNVRVSSSLKVPVRASDVTEIAENAETNQQA